MRRPNRRRKGCCQKICFALAVTAFLGAVICLSIFSAKCMLFFIAIGLIALGVFLLKL